MPEYDVILTNPCGETGETVEKSLVSKGLNVKVITGPSARKTEAWFLKTLKAAVEESGARMIIPIFFQDVLSAHRDEFPGIIIPLDDAAKIRLLDNKISACALADELGIPQPHIYKDIHDVERFPVVFKRPGGQGGDSVYFPRTPKALEYLYRNTTETIVQDYIDGDNYCVDALRWDGFFFATVYKVLLPKGKGVSILRESVEDPELVGMVKKLLDHVDYHGVCGVDFIRESTTGDPFFLECNPRFSGGLESAIASGFDLPYVYWCLASGYPVPEDAVSFRSGVLTGKAAPKE